MSGFAGHIDSWLATARQEKIASLKGAYGYNPQRYTRETCIYHNAFREYIHPHLARWRLFPGRAGHDKNYIHLASPTNQSSRGERKRASY